MSQQGWGPPPGGYGGQGGYGGPPQQPQQGWGPPPGGPPGPYGPPPGQYGPPMGPNPYAPSAYGPPPDMTPPGSLPLGLLAGFFGGCIGLALVLLIAKGPATKRGAGIGFMLQVVLGLVLRLAN